MVAEEGLDKMVERHMKYSVIAQKEITTIGLKFLVENDHKRLTSVLIVTVTVDIKRDTVVDYLYKNYSIAISKGVPPIDKVWRIGISGDNVNRQTVKLLVTVLKEAVEAARRYLSV
jgi:aspartate aminotransferase-like enzyme